MRILGIESSAKAASCALLRDGELEAVSFQNVGLTHSRTLMPMVEGMLKNGDIPLSSVDMIAVANGPGSFTGVRIGVATGLGLAAGSGIRAVGVSTLAAMAELAAHTGAIALCAMDARRSEVYGAAFDGSERLTDDRAMGAAEFAAEVAELAKKREKSIICLGDGAELCYNELINSGEAVTLAPPHLLRQSAAGVAMLAERLWSEGFQFQPLRPVYLRPSQAERERAARQ